MAVTTHVDSTAAAIQFSDAHTLILYQANNDTVHQLTGDGPVVSPRTAYVDEQVSAADNVRDGTPLAVTGVSQTRLYFTNKSQRLCQLIRSPENPTWKPEEAFDSKEYTTQKNSTLLYATSDTSGPTVGFQAESDPADYITQVRGSDSTIVQGGQNYVTLVNGTPYQWDLSAPNSIGMTSWSFPLFIAAGKSVSVYLDRDATVAICSGEVTYTLGSTGKNFQVKAKESGTTFTLVVLLKNIETQNNEKGTTIDLGWKGTHPVNFILSGEVGNLSSTNMPKDWMQTNLSRLGNRTLRHLCIPGSHDAGMSEATGKTIGVSSGDVVTQKKRISGQLAEGTRYFDIRPVFDKSKTPTVYYTGHYTSDKRRVGIYLGANGQPIEDIIDDINAFTITNKELIILRLSHDIAYRKTAGVRQGSKFTQAQWDDLFEKLKRINHRFTIGNPTSVDLTKLQLNQFIDGQPAVVIIVKFPNSEFTLGTYANDGFYLYSQLDSYNQFVNNPDTNVMAQDQIEKMHNIRTTSPDSRHFVLSWTLTKKSNGGTSILELADAANPELYKRLLPSSSQQSYPNVLYTDAIDNSDLAALSMVINNIFSKV